MVSPALGSYMSNLTSHFPRFLVGGATVQFIISTVHIAAGLRSMIEGFIWSNEVPGGSYHYWENMTRAVYILQEAATVTNVIFLLRNLMLLSTYMGCSVSYR